MRFDLDEVGLALLILSILVLGRASTVAATAWTSSPYS
jgi:hypothetical protein